MKKSKQAADFGPNLELGDLLELFRYSYMVGGKFLTINEVCKMASMSTRTYYKPVLPYSTYLRACRGQRGTMAFNTECVR